MAEASVGVNVSGGQLQGVIADKVVIENLTFYSRAPDTPEPTAGTEPIGPCPYPGLAYFGPNDAHLFFGRDTAIARLTAAVGRQSFTALVGASGSGKSSVVLAGLAPRLNDAGSWRFSHFRVGTELERNPFLALARALAPLYVASDSDVERLRNTKLLASSLASGELTLRDVFADCRSKNKGRRILLIADQFEEAFTLVEDEEVRNRFIDVLLAGFPDPAAGEAPDICLMLTMRADFYGRALRHRPLADALQNHVENLGPMNREELQAAILRPAENAKVAFEPGVVETLLDAVVSKPGGLPLLQFALREMWARQARKTITRKSYDEIGGVEGALAQRAETVFAGLTRDGADPDMDKAFQRLFTRLVTLGEGQEDTRRIVERTELGDEAWGLAQRLADEENRLVVTSAASSHETAEVVHEALIRHWPKLVDWINRDRAFQSWLRQIAAGIELWSANPDDDGPLLRSGMLAQATEWLARRRDDLSAKERSYIEASISLRQRADAEKEAARQAKIEAAEKLATEQQQRAKIAFRLGGVAAIAAAAAIALAVFAMWQMNKADEARQEAERQTERAEESRLQEERQAQEARDQTIAAQRRRALMVAGLSMKETSEGRPERGLLLALAVDPGRMLRSNRDLINRDNVPALTVAAERAIYAGVPLRSFELGSPGMTATFSPDGKRIVAATNDNGVRIWEAATGKEIRAFKEYKDLLRSAAFSPDGQRVVAAYSDRTARIWDIETGRELAKFAGHTGIVERALFSPDGRRIVTGSQDKTARIWDAQNGQELHTLTGHEQSVWSIAISADGQRIATASPDNTLRIWDAESGQSMQSFNAPPGESFGSVAFSPDGDRVVIASSRSTAFIWQLRTGGMIGGVMVRALKGHRSHVVSAAFSPDGRRIVTASWDKTARVWDTQTGQELRALDGHQGWVHEASFSADGQRIVTVSEDGTARIWDTETGQEVRSQEGFSGGYNGWLSADGRRFISAIAPGEARIWETESGKLLRTFKAHETRIYGAAFSDDGHHALTTSADESARVWEVESGRQLRTLGHGEPVWNGAFSPDGRRVVTVGNKSARIWELESGKQLLALVGHADSIGHAAFSPDGRRILTASLDMTARIWEAESGRELHVLKDRASITGVAFNPLGSRVVTAAGETAQIWDAESGRELRALTGHIGTITSVAFSPDGRRIVTASADNTARIWDAETGQEVHRLIGHEGDIVRRAAFSADGRRIVTAGGNAVQTWAVLPMADVWEVANQRKHRELSDAEKREFYLDD